jgi:hypothetical protein
MAMDLSTLGGGSGSGSSAGSSSGFDLTQLLALLKNYKGSSGSGGGSKVLQSGTVNESQSGLDLNKIISTAASIAQLIAMLG